MHEVQNEMSFDHAQFLSETSLRERCGRSKYSSTEQVKMKGATGQQLVKVLEMGMSVWNKSGETSIRLHKFNLAGLRSTWSGHSHLMEFSLQQYLTFPQSRPKPAEGAMGPLISFSAWVLNKCSTPFCETESLHEQAPGTAVIKP